jgi:hypothetical protein
MMWAVLSCQLETIFRSRSKSLQNPGSTPKKVKPFIANQLYKVHCTSARSCMLSHPRFRLSQPFLTTFAGIPADSWSN